MTQNTGADLSELILDGFRQAMRRLAGTVTIITVNAGDEQHGTMATAVTSVSMDPPSMLVCMNKTSRLHKYLLSQDHFCVNLLHAENLHSSRQFASPVSASERFASGDWQWAEGEDPFLADAQSSIFCAKDAQIPYGSHTIFIGKVTKVLNRDDISPLIYRDGDYGRCAALDDQPASNPPPAKPKGKRSG